VNPLENCSVCFSSGLLYILALIPTRIRSVRCAWHDPRQMTKRTLCRRIAVLLREQEVIALLNAKELAMEVLSVTKAYAVRA